MFRSTAFHFASLSSASRCTYNHRRITIILDKRAAWNQVAGR